jgi:hypothetical protein
MADDPIVELRLLRNENAKLKESASGLKSGGGGGTFGGMDDGRLSVVESRLFGIESEQRSHFRWSIGLTVTVALGLAGVIFTSTAFLMARVDRVEDRLSRLETNVQELPGKLTSSLNQVNQTLLQAITASSTMALTRPPPQGLPFTPPTPAPGLANPTK